jgi:predicted PurR-regulated permease PerM
MTSTAALEERRAGYSRLARIVTAVAATLATAILFGFLSNVQELVKQVPTHMAATNQKLSSIEAEQAALKVAIATLLKDYTSREQLQVELEKLNEKIRALQVKQAVIEMMLKSPNSGEVRQGGKYGQS